MRQPFLVGIGGTPKRGSTTELALRIALEAAGHAGAKTAIFDGHYLARLPLYLTEASEAAGEEMIDALRRADGVIIASPGYHGSVSGAVKNAVDYIEKTAKDERVYLDGLPIGLIVTAFGWQATGSTLATLRSIVHALRGWPTPLGAAINTAGGTFADGVCTDPAAARQLELVGQQVVTFAQQRLAIPHSTETTVDREAHAPREHAAAQPEPI